ncbi:P-loop NTPase [Pseudomonas sp. SIMBA_077]
MKTKHSVQVIAVTGGKGGTGKSTFAINVSLALATLGQRVALLDGNLELPCIDALLNIKPTKTLSDLIEGNCSLKDILYTGPGGVSLLLGAAYSTTTKSLSTAHYCGIINAFNNLHNDIDALIVDTASGAHHCALNFISAAHEVVMVICNEPASILNAHALISKLSDDYNIKKFRVIVNRAYSDQHGQGTFNTLLALTANSSDLSLLYAGHLPEDIAVRNATQQRRAVYELSPRSKYSRELDVIAKKINTWPLLTTPRGHIEFFMDSLIMAAHHQGTQITGE